MQTGQSGDGGGEKFVGWEISYGTSLVFHVGRIIIGSYNNNNNNNNNNKNFFFYTFFYIFIEFIF